MNPLPLNQLQNNAFFSGGAVLMVMGGLMAYMRALPRRLWYWGLSQISVEIDITGLDASYDWMLAWLNNQPYSKRSRRLSVQTALDGHTVVFTPAQGQHFFRYKGQPVWLSRGDDKPTAGTTTSSNADDRGFARKYETMHLRVLGRRQTLARSLVEDARTAYNSLLGEQVKLFRAGYDYWAAVGPLRDRPLDSVILPGNALNELLSDITQFLDTSAWYRDRGIPYRRGYLLHGHPGTGKSSLVAAIACHLKLPLYTLNLGSATMSDDRLQALLTYLPEKCILLMEDIDATKAHGAPVAARGRRRSASPEEAKSTLTLSGLLNALDGVGACEGRVLFMTTNHREALDPALIRRGRVDIELEFGKATREQVERLYRRFYDVPEREMLLLNQFADRFTMAELQGAFLQHRHEPQAALVQLQEAA